MFRKTENGRKIDSRNDAMIGYWYHDNKYMVKGILNFSESVSFQDCNQKMLIEMET